MAHRSLSRIDSAIEQLPESLQVTANRSWQRIREQKNFDSDQDHWSADDCAVLARLFACSDYAAAATLRQWQWFSEAISSGRFAVPPVAAFTLVPEVDEKTIKSQLRLYRHRQMLHILWREYALLSSLQETLESLSSLADELLINSCEFAGQMLSTRFGKPVDERGRPVSLVILAMGKLGGFELNLSSDIDIIFLYSAEGETKGPAGLSTSQYFTRLARRVVRLLDDVTEDGFVFRVDTRLRPFGESGPLVTSFASFDSYLVQHGRSWERYAYVKARVIAGDEASEVVSELMHTTIEPFVYRRYLDFGVFESLRDMHSMIASEATASEFASNIKLGSGGIREIEFIVQSLQLVRGGNNEKLRRPELGKALRELDQNRMLPRGAADKLLAAYRFLRRLENFIQAIRDQQTHDLPVEAADRARLALAMQFDGWDALDSALAGHRCNVSQCFQEIAFRVDTDTKPELAESTFGALWDLRSNEQSLARLLTQLGFSNSGEVAKELNSFARSADVQRIDSSAEERLLKFMPTLLGELHTRESPQLVLQRVLKIVIRILRRSAYLALLNENRPALQRLVDLCEQSAFLASEIERFPLLLDEMLDPRLFTSAVSTDDMHSDIAERLRQVDRSDSERRIEVLSQYQQATLFRIAIADFSGELPIMKVSDALTALAELVLTRALDIAWQDLVRKHGTPWCAVQGCRRQAVFLHDSAGDKQRTDGEKSLENSMFFARLVRRLVHFLTTQTSSGALYEVDTRLRPSGRAGLLVTSVEAFERYQLENAWTWEHQALLRSRPVAGSVCVKRAFENVRTETLRFRVDQQNLAAEVSSMRSRMRQKLDKSTQTLFDLKQGSGGIADVEFLVQFKALENARNNPAVIHYRDNIRQLGTLAADGCLPGTVVSELQAIYRAYRACLHRLALDDQPPLVSNSEFKEERQFVVGLWRQHLDGAGQ